MSNITRIKNTNLTNLYNSHVHLLHRVEISASADKATTDIMTKMRLHAWIILVLCKDQDNQECNAEDTGTMLCTNATITPTTTTTVIWVNRGYPV